MRNTIFQIHDREGSFSIDQMPDGRYSILVDDMAEAAGWTVEPERLKQIADFLYEECSSGKHDMLRNASEEQDD